MTKKHPTTGAKPPESPISTAQITHLDAERAKRWETQLLRASGKTGKPKKVFANVVIALRNAPEWKGALSFDASAYVVLLNRKPPAPWDSSGKFTQRIWEEQDDRLLTEWMQHKGIDVGSHVVADAVETVARERTFHPIRDYLLQLKWDSTPRIDKWLHKYAGAEDTPLNAAFGSKWLISAVARAMLPGCKVDCMLILEGLTGIGKSTLFRELASREWFTDKLEDNLGDKDAVMTIAGKWIVECAELESLKGNSVERLKAFLSREVDRYRPPYGRHSIDSKRQCVFCGTTNSLEYLRDLTGNRRYWPVKASACDLAGITKERDQLWAEAKARFDQGENWWLSGELQQLQAAAVEQRMAVEIDPWEEPIADFMFDKTEIRTQKLIFKLFGINELEQTKNDQKRVATILRRLDFRHKRKREGTGNYWFFVKEPRD